MPQDCRGEALKPSRCVHVAIAGNIGITVGTEGGLTINPDAIVQILNDYKAGKINLGRALEEMKDFPYGDLGDACIDNHRQLRVGYPEVVFCAGKTAVQVRDILEHLLSRGSKILATRADQRHFDAVRDLSDDLVFDAVSRTITQKRDGSDVEADTYIAVVTAGTSDIPVAEEAAVTAEVFGNVTERIFDVGVAGLHRLLGKIDLIRGARVIIAVAGMEGALPSVLGGLVDKPIIAVPTSVGYGANFGGVSALLTMLNSCAAGVSVVNIDNGFGAGYIASSINRL